jgi:3'-5' exoribonuclease
VISELKAGTNIKGAVFLVSKKAVRQTKANKDYLALTLRDKSGTIEARAWDPPKDLDIKVDDFVMVAAEVEEYREELQLKVKTIDFVPEAEINIADFLPCAERSGEEMYADLIVRINRDIQSADIKKLLLMVIENPAIKPGLLKAPAATMYHHAYIGGLLEHILSLWGASWSICAAYPDLDRDVLLAACVLHDIGKVQELSYEKSFKYTFIGNMAGHVLVGWSSVTFAMKQIQTPPAVRGAILHVIASHHGDEFGAAKPSTKEAVVFHHLDMIDSRMGGIRRALADDKDGGEFVRVPILGSKQVYRGRV